MKKQILNLGKALSKVEQKSINGGLGETCGYTFPGKYLRCINFPIERCIGGICRAVDL